jgi:hypothetical protein
MPVSNPKRSCYPIGVIADEDPRPREQQGRPIQILTILDGIPTRHAAQGPCCPAGQRQAGPGTPFEEHLNGR